MAILAISAAHFQTTPIPFKPSPHNSKQQYIQQKTKWPSPFFPNLTPTPKWPDPTEFPSQKKKPYSMQYTSNTCTRSIPFLLPSEDLKTRNGNTRTAKPNKSSPSMHFPLLLPCPLIQDCLLICHMEESLRLFFLASPRINAYPLHSVEKLYKFLQE